ncbi:hypothetical protein Srot_2883 [Segniliparus rotundus DSM 44985]|uniref:Uncharacterized protein n=1 Tax=Segniliparus rotundus (strain ATCC BAA-972 / CDC 1076 / CIP 108378 / DSM 44985 / JCM 13578) TaxID=640132 RepID=D6ZDQ7_SEGRD|nr:hypothetical protein [Segniliparus rotundus]ADG99314.1 hypothetical protein Srot_2883 [Segniliparus rotundus DSM 44985]
MPKIALAALFAGAALVSGPALALADPDTGGDDGGAYPCPNNQFWYPQYNQCVTMCPPGSDHLNGPEACDKIPTAYRQSERPGLGRQAPAAL